MGNMPDLQRVIDALTNCLDDFAPCRDCAYHDERKPELCGGVSNLMQDCLTLLESMVPRVMSLEEVITSDKPFVIEDISGDIGWATFFSEYEQYGDMIIRMVNSGGEVDDRYKRMYDTKWRCWTNMPTEEQRIAVKWIA